LSSTTPTWRNVLISNVTATAASGSPAGTIWARIERPATNFVFDHVTVTASKGFNVFSGYGIQFVDSRVIVPSGLKTFNIYDSQLIVSNRSASANLVTLDGITTNGYGNALEFYDATASLSNTNVVDDGPVTIGGGTLTISNNYTMVPATLLSFIVGTNASQMAVMGNLTLGGTIDIAGGLGFGPGTNVLMTCTGSFGGTLPALGSVPVGYSYALDTNTPRQLRLAVIAPTPSLSPVSIAVEAPGDHLVLSWPADHTGWRLQIQTNNSPAGLGANWATWANSQQTNQVFLPVDRTLGAIFLRLVYP
jgi:hypothetical protein